MAIALNKNTCVPKDLELLAQYRQYLNDNGLDEAEREEGVATGTRFLTWWRERIVGPAYEVHPHADHLLCRGECDQVGETFLRATCADHQSRCVERSKLSSFLRYLT